MGGTRHLDGVATEPGTDGPDPDTSPGAPEGGGRAAPLRVDARRNLEHVLRAAREVFGELGYGAPMEDVARRARVGVGTVYRRFPSKHVLVRRIAEEETARLTEQARTALRQEGEPWPALARFLRTSAASGAGRLLPPEILRVGVEPALGSTPVSGSIGAGAETGAGVDGGGRTDVATAPNRSPGADEAPGEPRVPQQRRHLSAVQGGEPSVVLTGDGLIPGGEEPIAGASGSLELLGVVGELVRRAREAGELRADVTVADMLLVIATAAPALPDAEQQRQASDRLLDILLEGLRSRPRA
ncbi:TetR/AcrR family transcriptional regulator [Streptomyces sp. GSL17-111]|uniref:TetR/AcrR family transcriptional regulator n=1 Tax=Streptomyces sp. GSL17-111 TaxID=3121596 RepID=UPI0030F3AE9D